jgi:chromosome segregation protein
VGLAEVTLLFANDGSLQVPWSEVAVARRLYRSGESEYLLNRSVCRLRDVLDLFAGTGVNPKAYALMDQDRLSHVLTAKPWERRIFVEEAAGVARYKQQRAEAQGKLEGTRQNLGRVRDVMDEVKRQLGSLERQARKAQQYKALSQERQQLALVMVAADFAALTASREALVREMASLRAREGDCRATIATLIAREAAQRAGIQEAEYRLGDLRQSVQKMQGELERLLERREQLGIQIRELGEEEARLEAEGAAVGARRRALAEERLERGRALDEARLSHAAREGLARELEARLAASRLRLQQLRDRAEALRHEQVRVAGERAEHTRAAGELRERCLQLARRAERLAAEETGARAEAEAIAAARQGLEEIQRRSAAELSLLESERRAVEQDLDDQEGERTRLQAALGESRLELAARRSRLEALERLEREREGYAEGVRALFAPDAVPLPGVVGTVADLLEVPGGLEAAVEAVLGDRLQWVVVERFEHARAGLAHLDREGAGAATFLPLETLPPDATLPDDSPEVRWAARAVAGPPPALLHYLLGRVGIVDHLDQAEMLWRRNGVVATYVTPEGDVLWPGGRLSGGRRNGHDRSLHSILGRKRSIKELRLDVERVARQALEQEGALSSLEARIATVRARDAALRDSVRIHSESRLRGEKELEAVDREGARVRRHLDTLTVEQGQLELETRETTERLDAIEGELAATEEAHAELAREFATVREALDGAQQAEEGLLGELTGCRVDLAAVAERVEALGRDVERLGDLEREADERLAQAAVRRQQLVDRRGELGEERARTEAHARAASVERDGAEAELRALADEHALRAAERDQTESDRKAAEHEAQQLVGRCHELDLRETEGRVRSEELLLEARRSHGVDRPEALLAAHDPGRDLPSARGRHEELTAKLEGMGPVNLVADEEYRELEERLTFLRTQHDDLAASIKDLERGLRGMTRTAHERFQEAFDQINHHFGEIFSRLFEGGRAELRLVPPEDGQDQDPLDWGIELMAQPRGKRLQSVTLMSGGEKALTGLALLFAIFYFRPSPFCVLDEVDAPLDDANIHRFLRVLRELCSQTQFLVITHNRKTMGAADVLYGVTMEEPGLSRLVSVRLTA